MARDETRSRPGVRLLTWNIFHGRDFPPDPALFTLRSRFLRRTESNATHAQVNRSLAAGFAEVIAAAHWEVCLLQEAPPGWAGRLTRAAGAGGFRALTSRNQLGPARRLAARWNPDLLGANEGGSNLILFRAPWRMVEPGRSLLLNPLRERGLSERRRMAFVHLRSPHGELCVANVHLSTRPRVQAEREAQRAADAAVLWARDVPLVLGGDFNLRPSSSAALDLLRERHGLAPPTGDDAIDHLLGRGLEVPHRPRPWPPERRELDFPLPAAVRRLRLSDHAPVEAVFRLPATGVR